MDSASLPETAKPLKNSIEFIPGPEQQKLEKATALAVTALIERNDRLTLALRRIILHISICNVVAAKTVAEEALEGQMKQFTLLQAVIEIQRRLAANHEEGTQFEITPDGVTIVNNSSGEFVCNNVDPAQALKELDE